MYSYTKRELFVFFVGRNLTYYFKKEVNLLSNEKQAVIQKISNGHKGKYAVTTLVDTGDKSIEGSITFLLKKPVWSEEYLPERGVFVMLSNLCKKRNGWRAMKARPWSISDETAMSKGVFNEKAHISK